MLQALMRLLFASCCALAMSLLACRPLPSSQTTDPDDGPRDPDWLAQVEHHRGLFDVYVDHDAASLYLALPPADTEVLASCLYVGSLATGLGSSAVGLDRAELASTRWIQFRRVGSRVFVEEINTSYRADSTDVDERQAARDSFPTSILWAGDVDRTLRDGSTVVDFTSFVVRDGHNIATTLADAEQGQYSLDRERSTFVPRSVLAFPDNLELEADLTFAGTDPGRYVERSTPEPTSLTLRLHHSFVRLPDDGYRPRRWHPASGAIDADYVDFAAPLDQRLTRRVATRHRLVKRPGTDEPVEPIVYYVDRGAPEPIRSALIEGASWWAEAFDAAGFRNAFRVELLPADAHPLDVRYHVISWVHRQRRGWSYGASIRDPRTGEIIKGNVTLGSQRIRQDILLLEGLVGAGRTGRGSPDDPVQLALARIRQLSAHEVGHTLGLQHNFAASTYGRASVMDYPAPKARLVDGRIDLSDAYGVGIGVWDRQAIRYLYTEFAPQQEAAGLRAILEENRDRGWLYLNDSDARRAASAHPMASLWDNGEDPIAELTHVLEVRRVALSRFGADNLAPSAEWADLEPVFVPLYFHHRYQQTSAAKSIGGALYDRGPRTSADAMRPVDAATQRRALDAVLAIVDPVQLDVPEAVLRRLTPGDEGERLQSNSWPVFDALGAAATATQHVLDDLLVPARLARLVEFHRRDPEQLGLEELLDRVIRQAFRPTPASARHAELARVIQSTTVDALLAAARRPDLPASVRDRIERRLVRLRRVELRDGSRLDREHRASLDGRVRRHLDRPHEAGTPPAPPVEPPPGSPIGMPAAWGDGDAGPFERARPRQSQGAAELRCGASPRDR
ncbi:MAG: DUF5117 domain-containing protein [Myxococcales bacterium FL481]|nr:MAG: DUF5117 domain-containing protein [Myxococcales bacterium FL481]